MKNRNVSLAGATTFPVPPRFIAPYCRYIHGRPRASRLTTTAVLKGLKGKMVNQVLCGSTLGRTTLELRGSCEEERLHASANPAPPGKPTGHPSPTKIACAAVADPYRPPPASAPPLLFPRHFPFSFFHSRGSSNV
ncbi:hypothetical protein E2C01_035582 [Portunus trituberculatus]|uniref:Uncharacterized protein n=1 Tax=Portunus trituberculatus TaxID=210409 RepID=A0A5B7F4K3_PORTR|nr:hypothetical protein [Portunus trituberculatus]